MTAASCCRSARGRSCKGHPAAVAAVCSLSAGRGGGSGSGVTAQAPAHPTLTCGGGSLYTQTLRLRVGGWPRPGVHCGGGRAGTRLEHRRGGRLSLAGLVAGNLPSGWTLRGDQSRSWLEVGGASCVLGAVDMGAFQASAGFLTGGTWLSTDPGSGKHPTHPSPGSPGRPQPFWGPVPLCVHWERLQGPHSPCPHLSPVNSPSCPPWGPPECPLLVVVFVRCSHPRSSSSPPGPVPRTLWPLPSTGHCRRCTQRPGTHCLLRQRSAVRS